MGSGKTKVEMIMEAYKRHGEPEIEDWRKVIRHKDVCRASTQSVRLDISHTGTEIADMEYTMTKQVAEVMNRILGRLDGKDLWMLCLAEPWLVDRFPRVEWDLYEYLKVNPYYCGLCSRRFAVRTRLNFHINVDHAPKTYTELQQQISDFFSIPNMERDKHDETSPGHRDKMSLSNQA